MVNRAPVFDPDEQQFMEEFGLRPREGSCLPLDQLLAANAGAMSGAHLETCASCAALVRDFTSSEAADLQPPEKERIRTRVRDRIRTDRRRALAIPLAIAAAVAIVVIGLSLWSPPRPADAPPRSTPVAATAGEGAVATRRTPPSVPARALEPAPVRLPAAMLTWRNDADRQFAGDFGPAIALYRDAKYAEAAEQFEQVSRRHPSSAEAFFYLGVSQLFLRRHADAIANLQRARQLDRGALSDLIDRYLAFAHQR